jgi:hypothetical protein
MESPSSLAKALVEADCTADFRDVAFGPAPAYCFSTFFPSH